MLRLLRPLMRPSLYRYGGMKAARHSYNEKRFSGSSGDDPFKDSLLDTDSFLDSDSFTEMEEEGSVDPTTIRFSQNSIGANFKDGGSVSELSENLKSGAVDDSSSGPPPVRIVEKDGKIFTLDNRRLKAHQDAGVKIKYKKLNKIPKRELFKFTTENDGTDIDIRKPD